MNAWPGSRSQFLRWWSPRAPGAIRRQWRRGGRSCGRLRCWWDLRRPTWPVDWREWRRAAGNSFAPTDALVVVWFSVNQAQAGDVPGIDWYAPDGSLYKSAAWDPLPSGGNWCLWGSGRMMFGAWTAAVSWNGAPLFTQKFNLSP